MRSKNISVLCFACACLLSACATQPNTPALTSGTPFVPNACVIDAIDAYTRLKDTGADPKVLEIHYRTPTGGKVGNALLYKNFGHDMTVFTWVPDDGSNPRDPNSADYAFDRTNASTPLPAYIDPNSAIQVAKFFIPQAYEAFWRTPKKDKKGKLALPPVSPAKPAANLVPVPPSQM